MKNVDGQWLKPPPDYDPIKTEICDNNLNLFISMNQEEFAVGHVMNKEQLWQMFSGT